jgi:hypothetical protein
MGLGEDLKRKRLDGPSSRRAGRSGLDTDTASPALSTHETHVRIRGRVLKGLLTEKPESALERYLVV